jgi:hypothetical protein
MGGNLEAERCLKECAKFWAVKEIVCIHKKPSFSRPITFDKVTFFEEKWN